MEEESGNDKSVCVVKDQMLKSQSNNSSCNNASICAKSLKNYDEKNNFQEKDNSPTAPTEIGIQNSPQGLTTTSTNRVIHKIRVINPQKIQKFDVKQKLAEALKKFCGNSLGKAGFSYLKNIILILRFFLTCTQPFFKFFFFSA